MNKHLRKYYDLARLRAKEKLCKNHRNEFKILFNKEYVKLLKRGIKK